MPNISELKESRFLKQTDCGAGILVTISGCTQENVAKEGAEPELKWCLHFTETSKPLVLNSTNGQIIASITGQDDTDNWTGHKIVLYADPNITFGGKLVGGIRARAPKGKATAVTATARPPIKNPVAKPAPVPAVEAEPDDIPF